MGWVRRAAAAATAGVLALTSATVIGATTATAAKGPAPIAVSAVQTSTSKMSTTIRTQFKVPGTKAKTTTLRVYVKPVGGKTVVKTVKAKKSGRYYTGSLKVSSKNAVSVIVKRKYKRKWVTAAKASTVYQSSKISGWSSSASRRVGAGSLTKTVKVSPAFGRYVYLQQHKGGKWATVKKYRTSKSRTSSVRVSIPESRWGKASTTKWRVYAPAVKGKSRSKVTSTMTLRRVPEVSTPTPIPIPTPTPTPSPGPDEPQPFTDPVAKRIGFVWPFTKDGLTWRANCLPAEQFYNRDDRSVWKRDIDCSKQETMRTVLGTWTVEPECGVTKECPARRDIRNSGTTFIDWYMPTGTPPAKYSNSVTLIANGWLDDLNRERAAVGGAPFTKMPIEMLSASAPGKNVSTSAYVRDSSGKITSRTFSAAGQGGFAQYWIDKTSVGQANIDALVIGKSHSCGASASDTHPLAGDCSPLARTAENDASTYFNTYLPADKNGYKWYCGEYIGGGVLHGDSNGWMSEMYKRTVPGTNDFGLHWTSLAMSKPSTTNYVSVGARVGDDGTMRSSVLACALVDSGRNFAPAGYVYQPVS